MKFSFLSLCLALWALLILPFVMAAVAILTHLVHPWLVIPVLYMLFVAPSVYLWYNYKKNEGTLPSKGYKVRPPEKVLEEYIEISTKSGERPKKQTSTAQKPKSQR